LTVDNSAVDSAGWKAGDSVDSLALWWAACSAAETAASKVAKWASSKADERVEKMVYDRVGLWVASMAGMRELNSVDSLADAKVG